MLLEPFLFYPIHSSPTFYPFKALTQWSACIEVGPQIFTRVSLSLTHAHIHTHVYNSILAYCKTLQYYYIRIVQTPNNHQNALISCWIVLNQNTYDKIQITFFTQIKCCQHRPQGHYNMKCTKSTTYIKRNLT